MVNLAISISSLALSIISLILSTVAIGVIIGFKNSTHTIEWKPLDTKPVSDDPFESPEVEAEKLYNPLKRKIPNPFPTEAPVKDDSFADLEDPNETSNNW